MPKAGNIPNSPITTSWPTPYASQYNAHSIGRKQGESTAANEGCFIDSKLHLYYLMLAGLGTMKMQAVDISTSAQDKY